MEYSYTGAYGEFLAREIGVEWLGGIRRHLFPPGSMEASRNLVRTMYHQLNLRATCQIFDDGESFSATLILQFT